MKLRDVNLEVNEIYSFIHPSSSILPSFSLNVSRLLFRDYNIFQEIYAESSNLTVQ